MEVDQHPASVLEEAPLHRRMSSSWHGASLSEPASPDGPREALAPRSSSDAKAVAASRHGAGAGEAESSSRAGGSNSGRDARVSDSCSGGLGGQGCESMSSVIPASVSSPTSAAREAFVGWPRAVVVHSELRTEAGFVGVLHE